MNEEQFQTMLDAATEKIIASNKEHIKQLRNELETYIEEVINNG